MKPVTIRFWVNDDQPTAVLDGASVTVKTLRAFLLTLDQKHTRIEQLTDEQLGKIADGNAERAYRQTITDIVDDLKSEIKNGNISDRDGAMEWIEQTIDGHHDVIYTYAAQEVCRHSSNDGAYFDEFGTDGAVEDGGIQWSKLAYAAMRADVMEEVGDLDELFAEDDEEDEDDNEG